MNDEEHMYENCKRDEGRWRGSTSDLGVECGNASV